MAPTASESSTPQKTRARRGGRRTVRALPSSVRPSLPLGATSGLQLRMGATKDLSFTTSIPPSTGTRNRGAGEIAARSLPLLSLETFRRAQKLGVEREEA